MSLLTSGKQTRTAICPICDRQFRGDYKMVNKLLSLHDKKVHPDISFNKIFQKGLDPKSLNKDIGEEGKKVVSLGKEIG